LIKPARQPIFFFFARSQAPRGNADGFMYEHAKSQIWIPTETVGTSSPASVETTKQVIYSIKAKLSVINSEQDQPQQYAVDDIGQHAGTIQ
jgi:hypothetical protein